MMVLRRRLAVLILAAAPLASAQPAGAVDPGANVCRPQALAELDRLQVSVDDLESLRLVTERSGGRAGSKLNVNAWARFPGKRGNLVIVMRRPSCAVETIYTTGEVEVPGVSRY